MCARWKGIAGAAACLLIAVVLVCNYATPPREWRQIHIGDTPEQVCAKWPAVVQNLQDIKGDFCFYKLPLALWRLQIVYGPDHRVLHKHGILRLGTRNWFQDFRYEEIGTC